MEEKNIENMPKALILNQHNIQSVQEIYLPNKNIQKEWTMIEENEIEIKEEENLEPIIKKLSSCTSVLSSAVMYHYILGTPKVDDEDLMYNLSKVMLNTICNYLPKSIHTTYTTIPNLEDSFVCAETKRYVLQILYGLNMFFEHISKASSMLKKNETLDEENLTKFLVTLQKNEKKRKMQSIYDIEGKETIKQKKIEKLRNLLLEKATKMTKKHNEKVKLMIKSMVSSLAPVLVTSLDCYFNPHLLTRVLKVSQKTYKIYKFQNNQFFFFQQNQTEIH